MELGRTMILNPISDHDISLHQQSLLNNQHIIGEGDQQAMVSTAGDQPVQQQPFVSSYATDDSSFNAVSNELNNVNGIKRPLAVKRMDPPNKRKSGGSKKSAGKSITDTVKRVMIQLAKINACDDDGLLRLRNGDLSSCDVNKLVRLAMSKTCDHDDIEDFMDQLVKAKVDPNLFKNEQFKSKLMEKIVSTKRKSKRQPSKVTPQSTKKHNEVVEDVIDDVVPKPRKRRDIGDTVEKMEQGTRLDRGIKRKLIFDSTDSDTDDSSEILKLKAKRSKTGKGLAKGLRYEPDESAVLSYSWIVPK